MIDYQFIILQNPWWKSVGLIKNDPKIKEFEKSLYKFFPKEVVDFKYKPGAVNILYGPRQTGKSTAVKLLIKKLLEQNFNPENILYFSCDALLDKKDVIDLVLNFLSSIKGTNYIFLDEISAVPDWPYAIKWLVDGGMLSKSNILLTGSSSINLKRSGEFMPGRRFGGKDIKYLPVGFYDYVGLVSGLKNASLAKNFKVLISLEKSFEQKSISLKELHSRFILSGGFLKVMHLIGRKESLTDTTDLYKNTVLSELAKFGKKELFAKKVLEKIITGLTSETSYAAVAEEAELGSKNTAADYLMFFEDSFFVKQALFYDIAQKKIRLKKNKKYYPTDPFLFWVFNALVYGASDIYPYYEKYSQPPLAGQVCESFIASELYKKNFDFYFFKNSRELDFYIPKFELGIEVKYKDKISSEDLRSLDFSRNKILVSKNTLEMRGDVWVVPYYLFPFIDLSSLAV